MFVLHQKVGGFTKFAALALTAVVLDLAELFHGVLELPGEAGGIEAEPRDLLDGVLGRKRGVSEYGVFELEDAVESPGGVGEELD